MADMFRTSIRFTPNVSGLVQLNGPTGVVGRGLRKAAEETVGRAKRSVNAYGRVDTRWMRDSIHATLTGSNQYQARMEIMSDAPYAIYQHEGFRHYQSGKMIPPAPFLRNALDRLRATDFV